MQIFIPIILGTIVGLISGNFVDYDFFVKPEFYPPNFLFPLIWSILYLLMGVSAYILKKQDSSLKVFYLQLIVNLLWPFMFSLSPLLGFIWILLLIFLVIFMLLQFFYTNKLAFYLQIPYLIWLLFAALLNLSIVILN